MRAAKTSAGVTPEVNLRNPLCTGEKAGKQGIHPGFETQGICHHKSKRGVSVAPQNDLVDKFTLLLEEYTTIIKIQMRMLSFASHVHKGQNISLQTCNS